MDLDEFPLEFESDPENPFAPRKWFSEIAPAEPEVIVIPSPEELPRFDSGMWEWDTGSTEKEEGDLLESLFL